MSRVRVRGSGQPGGAECFRAKAKTNEPCDWRGVKPVQSVRIVMGAHAGTFRSYGAGIVVGMRTATDIGVLRTHR